MITVLGQSHPAHKYKSIEIDLKFACFLLTGINNEREKKHMYTTVFSEYIKKKRERKSNSMTQITPTRANEINKLFLLFFS